MGLGFVTVAGVLGAAVERRHHGGRLARVRVRVRLGLGLGLGLGIGFGSGLGLGYP